MTKETHIVSKLDLASVFGALFVVVGVIVALLMAGGMTVHEIVSGISVLMALLFAADLFVGWLVDSETDDETASFIWNFLFDASVSGWHRLALAMIVPAAFVHFYGTHEVGREHHIQDLWSGLFFGFALGFLVQGIVRRIKARPA